FFFSSRRRHTRSDRDWSSDVCSSDLTKQLDMRLGKLLASSGKRRVRLALDIYNVFNSSDWQTISTRLSNVAATNRWQRPTLILRSEERRVGKEWRSGWSA